MTLPHEEKNAILLAKDFLMKLLDPKETPRVPRDVREYARRVLRHYPGEWQVNRLYRGKA